MKIETENLEDHQVRLTVEVEPETFDEAKRRAARMIAKKTKIPGFRPGKAPYHVVQRFVGEESLFEDGLEILVKDLYPKIIEQAEIDPYGPGSLAKISEMDPLTLEFVVPLAAKVTLGDYHALKIPYEPIEVTDDDVGETLNRLRENQAVEEPVNRPAEEGDRVFIRLNATKLSNKSEEHGDDQEIIIPERQVSFIVSSDAETSDHNWPYPGFSKELFGLSAGDEKTITYTFPEDSEIEELQGVSAEFQIKVEEVKSRTLPEVDDDFAQSVGEFENKEALLTEIREQLEQNAKSEYNNEYNEKLVNQVVEMSEVEFPRQMLDEEIDRVIHQLEHRLQNQNMDLETYMKVRGLDDQGIREEAKPMAETNLKQSLVLMEVSKAENIELEQAEVQAETAKAIEAMTSYMPESELRKIPKEELISNIINNVMVEMRINKTVNRLQSLAKGEYPSSQDDENQSESEEPELEQESDETSQNPDPEETDNEEDSIE